MSKNQTPRRKTLTRNGRLALIDSDDNFAFIAGYTSGGFPYGLTHEEFEKI
jgi:hypothetical protein